MLDQVDGMAWPRDINCQVRSCWEIFFQVRAAEVKGKSAAQICVGELFGPVVVDLAVFQDDMVFEGTYRILFIRHEIRPAAETCQLRTECLLQFLDES